MNTDTDTEDTPERAPSGTVLNIVGAHLYREDTESRVLPGLRNPDSAFAGNTRHFLAGHCQQQSALACLVREAQEEAELLIDPERVELAHVVHLVDTPGDSPRTGLVFRTAWSGTPKVLEFVPATDHPPESSRPETEVRRFAEQAVGRIARWTDTSWAREGSQVWRADGAAGGTWYVKVHQNDRFHDREVAALRTWVPHLGVAAPKLVTADTQLRAVVVTAVPGRPLHGTGLSPKEQRRLFHRIGALASAIHRSAPAPAARKPLGVPRPRLRPGRVRSGKSADRLRAGLGPARAPQRLPADDRPSGRHP
ncbi:NUDIX domain-containing protein [Streptomyces qinglanensis]|uniref:Aminoglycoside phosphotransferase domain-containing protein n=1 Tax=Streptomyces qinglanensis TaxID=943816 RepID=A0A1H9SY45_9ACTN|nr:NUDIX domain-containing protein [Streptomyces qinglanensis]SER89821.1 hypothetical protein SAMN05421870_105188 [Streptomyces qinglanensis]